MLGIAIVIEIEGSTLNVQRPTPKAFASGRSTFNRDGYLAMNLGGHITGVDLRYFMH